jgi:hypothetical protein
MLKSCGGSQAWAGGMTAMSNTKRLEAGWGSTLQQLASAGFALSASQRFDHDRPVWGGQQGKVIGIGGLHHPAACFNRNRDGMRVGEERGASMRLGKESPNEAGQGPIGVAEQQPIP